MGSRCFWRKDGVPVWENVDLVANEEPLRRFHEIRRFSRHWQATGKDTGDIMPLTDAWYYKERHCRQR
jgi:hypothetical protein